MAEIWKDFKGSDSHYQVSNLGNFASIKKDGSRRLRTPTYDRYGYKRVYVNINHKPTCVPIHRAVAMAFIPNPEGKPCINHINGVKTDNRVENLEWCTHKENSVHSVKVLGNKPSGDHIKQFAGNRKGFKGYKAKAYPVKHGEDNAAAKLTNEAVLTIRNDFGGKVSAEMLAKKYNVTAVTILNVVSRRTWKNI